MEAVPRGMRADVGQQNAHATVVLVPLHFDAGCKGPDRQGFFRVAHARFENAGQDGFGGEPVAPAVDHDPRVHDVAGPHVLQHQVLVGLEAPIQTLAASVGVGVPGRVELVQRTAHRHRKGVGRGADRLDVLPFGRRQGERLGGRRGNLGQAEVRALARPRAVARPTGRPELRIVTQPQAIHGRLGPPHVAQPQFDRPVLADRDLAGQFPYEAVTLGAQVCGREAGSVDFDAELAIVKPRLGRAADQCADPHVVRARAVQDELEAGMRRGDQHPPAIAEIALAAEARQFRLHLPVRGRLERLRFDQRPRSDGWRSPRQHPSQNSNSESRHRASPDRDRFMVHPPDRRHPGAAWTAIRRSPPAPCSRRRRAPGRRTCRRLGP